MKFRRLFFFFFGGGGVGWGGGELWPPWIRIPTVDPDFDTGSESGSSDTIESESTSTSKTLPTMIIFSVALSVVGNSQT
jgi:hypothetical protein